MTHHKPYDGRPERLLSQDPAAIDIEGPPSHPSTGGQGEQQQGADQLVGLPFPPHRDDHLQDWRIGGSSGETILPASLIVLPGAIALTLIFCGFSSGASVVIRPTDASLLIR